MKVFKFGGASVNSLERIKNVSNIIGSYKDEKLVVVVSAIGKTTNALEKVADAFFEGNQENALQLFENIKRSHLDTAKFLLVTEFNSTYDKLVNFFTEVEWLLHDKPVREYDYYYDQIVCVGELLSTAIVDAYLRENQIRSQWVDIRDYFRTDNNFRDAGIDWETTNNRISEAFLPLIGENQVVLTQGFIGATSENESTTLGREGSDYTAAILANLLDAENVTIWKDVEGVMNADPKAFSNAEIIAELNYEEVIEMAFYGAQVIHPKTIKPLQNKGIPLYVKCFLDISMPGTVIHNHQLKNLPPIIVVKKDQVLMHLRTLDFSFVGEKPIAALYEMLAEARLKANVVQSGAVSISIVMDNLPEKVQQLAIHAAEQFEVMVETDLQLLTIRHYTENALRDLTTDKTIILMQRTPETVQVLFSRNK
ncbi:MAG TPA: aspartate kinase [Flavitalea sp.]|nr:aspartate kinase [Flavitalea sp.]